MTKQVIYYLRECADCGKTFKVVVEKESGKILQGRYYGKLQIGMKYSYGIKYNPEAMKDEGYTPLQQWLKENIPCYLYPDEECNTPIYKRWWLRLLSSLLNRKRFEYWECQECIDYGNQEVFNNE